MLNFRKYKLFVINDWCSVSIFTRINQEIWGFKRGQIVRYGSITQNVNNLYVIHCETIGLHKHIKFPVIKNHTRSCHTFPMYAVKGDRVMFCPRPLNDRGCGVQYFPSIFHRLNYCMELMLRKRSEQSKNMVKIRCEILLKYNFFHV